MNLILFKNCCILFFFFSFISSCALKLRTNYAINDAPPLTQNAGTLVIVDVDSFKYDYARFLGIIEIKDPGLAIKCDYTTVISMLEEEARRIGANLVRIDNHQEPTLFASNCHQVRASAFFAENVHDYEVEIFWSDNRKLQMRDFKASIEKRPFQAATVSGISYSYQFNPFSSTLSLIVKSKFDCTKSYFKSSAYDSLVLRHEQLHFDLTEVYARLFLKRILDAKLDLSKLDREIEMIYDQIIKELDLKQDEYDSEVYKDRSLQEKWSVYVENELDKLSDYKHKAIKNYKLTKP